MFFERLGITLKVILKNIGMFLGLSLLIVIVTLIPYLIVTTTIEALGEKTIGIVYLSFIGVIVFTICIAVLYNFFKWFKWLFVDSFKKS